MILTGEQIALEISKGQITIEPFHLTSLNPNSCNYHLGEEAYELTPTSKTKIKLPKDGYTLKPGTILLGHTLERIGSECFVISLIGRSSLGRLGLFVQIDADMSNLGKAHRWTLELVAAQAIKIYPYMRIGQVSFWQATGKVKGYEGTYHDYDGPKESYYKRELL